MLQLCAAAADLPMCGPTLWKSKVEEALMSASLMCPCSIPSARPSHSEQAVRNDQRRNGIH